MEVCRSASRAIDSLKLPIAESLTRTVIGKLESQASGQVLALPFHLAASWKTAQSGWWRRYRIIRRSYSRESGSL